MNRIERVHISLGRQSRGHLCNEVDLVGFAGFCQMGFVPNPLYFAFCTIARLVIIGCVESVLARWLVIVCAEMQLAMAFGIPFEPVLLEPHAPQQLDSG